MNAILHKDLLDGVLLLLERCLLAVDVIGHPNDVDANSSS